MKRAPCGSFEVNPRSTVGHLCAWLRQAHEAQPQALVRVLEARFRHPLMLAGRLRQWRLAQDSQQASRLHCQLLYLEFQCWEVLGQAATLLPELHRLESTAAHEGWNDERALILVAIGRLAYSRGDYQEAAQCWASTIDHARLAARLDAEVEGRIGLGQIYDALGNGHTAARLHGDAAQMARELGDDYLVSKVAINQGFNLRVVGARDAASEAFHAALAAAERGGVRHYTAEALWQLADLACETGAWPEAQGLIERARLLAEAAGNRWLLGGVYRTLAMIRVHEGQDTAAREAYERALLHAEQTGARRQMADCLDGLALLAERAGDLAAALKCTRASKQLQAELLTQLHVAEGLGALGQYDLSEPPPLERMLLLTEELHDDACGKAAGLARLAHEGRVMARADALIVWEWSSAETAELVCVASAGVEAPELARWQSYPAEVRRSPLPPAEARVLHDVRAHPDGGRLRSLFAELGAGAVIEVPLRRAGDWVGLLLMLRRATATPWTREELMLGSHLAALVSHIEAQDQTRLAHLALVQANEELERRVQARTSELELANHALALANESLADWSFKDSMTGLYNRRFLDQHLDADLALALREADQSGALLVAYVIDIDHFKSINDRFGHEMGDAALIEAAQRLSHINRSANHLVRLGGEEFLLLARSTLPAQVQHVAERICGAFRAAPFELPGMNLDVRCSVGFACFPMRRTTSVLTWKETLDLADQALYWVKQSGRDGWAGVLPMAGAELPQGPLGLDALRGSALIELQHSPNLG